MKWLYPRLLAADPASVRVWQRDWSSFDVGTPADYLRTAQAVAATLGRPLDRGVGAQVDPAAEVSGSILWDDVHVGAGASLRDCVVADGVVVPPGMRLSRATVVRRGPDLAATGGESPGDLVVVPFDAAAK